MCAPLPQWKDSQEREVDDPGQQRGARDADGESGGPAGRPPPSEKQKVVDLPECPFEPV